MLKKYTNYLNLSIILFLIVAAFYSLKPINTQPNTVIDHDFQMKNVLEYLTHITKEPHYVGSQGHKVVQKTIVKALQKMGLRVEIQNQRIANRHNTYVRAENIIARIKGSNPNAKSLVLMSHYDSVPYASLGAGDDGSGVAVILEGVRTYLKQNTVAKNDIIILITDAEEEGLLGAKAFVNKHPWADNVGVVLNFEARGTAGTSYMLMETNSGSHQLLDTFKQSNNPYASSNSLGYSIYKMLPNDTDLTVFRRDKDISGYNFAYIGNHFNYHTALDKVENVSLNTLAQQAHYLVSMLKQLSNMDLNQLQSKQDDVYFKIPFGQIVSYSFDSAFILSLINLLLFVLVVTLGFKTQSLSMQSIFKSSFPLFKSILVVVILNFILLKFLYWIHPHYSEILQGFTYNGYWYVALFCLLTVAVCYFFYQNLSEQHKTANALVVPVLIWIIIDFLMALYLTGAHFFIVISFFGNLILLTQIIKKTNNSSIVLILSLPVIMLFAPMFMQLPVALGLAILPFSNLLLVLFVAVFIGNITLPEQTKITGWLFVIPIVILYIVAETHASYNQQRPLPDSLYYFQDDTNNSAFFMSQDNKTDNWNKVFFESNLLAKKELQTFRNNNWRRAKIVATTENRHIASAKIKLLNENSQVGKHRYIFSITPQRNSHLLMLKSNSDVNISGLSINGEVLQNKPDKTLKKGQYIARIFIADETEFIIELEIQDKQNLNLTLLELSPDLLQTKSFDILKRDDEFMPKPFVYTDSIITKQQIEF